LFTAFGNSFWSLSPGKPVATVPLLIYTYATGPYEDWHRKAWAASFVLLMVVLVTSVLTRAFLRVKPMNSETYALQGNFDKARSLAVKEVSQVVKEATDTVRMRVEGLSVYYGKLHAVKQVNLSIATNKVTALIGPSGCGKSTFLRCLNRMHELTPGARVEGKVLLDEQDLYGAGVDPVDVRRRVGMVFQKPNPFPNMSVHDNVVAGFKLNGTRDRKVLDEVAEKSLRGAALWDEVKD